MIDQIRTVDKRRITKIFGKISENEIMILVEKSWYKATKEEKEIDESSVWLKKSIFWFIFSLPLIAFMMYDFFPKLP